MKNILLSLKKIPNKIKIIYFIILLIGLIYLYWPQSAIPQFPKSHPPQNSDLGKIVGMPEKIFFTNKSKAETINFFRQNYFLPIGQLKIKAPITEYDNRYAKTIINDSASENISFLFEIGFPFKKSLLIRGFGEVDEKAALEKDAKKIINFSPDGKEKYNLRLAVYEIKPNLIAPLFVWLAVWLITPLLICSIIINL